MRKIISKQKEKKKQKIKQYGVGGVLVLLMLLSTIGYAFFGGEEETTNVNEINYNGYEFVNQNNFWSLVLGDLQFLFKYNPSEINDINASKIIGNVTSEEIDYLNKYYGKPLYIYSDDDSARYEVYRNLDPRVNKIVQRIQNACLNETNSTCDINLPIKDCSDNFIVIKEANEREIIQIDNCVFIYGEKENLTMVTDEFLFRVLGVKN